MPAPPLGAPDRYAWKDCAPAGPIALLLQRYHYFCCALDPHSLELHSKRFHKTALLTVTMQLLHPYVERRAIDHRFHQARSGRTLLKDIHSIDQKVFKTSLSKISKDDGCDDASGAIDIGMWHHLEQSMRAIHTSTSVMTPSLAHSVAALLPLSPTTCGIVLITYYLNTEILYKMSITH